MPELVITSDGSHTLFVPELDEHYHSIHGAVQESSIVFIRNGYEFCGDPVVFILEIGFGTGLNAFLTLVKAQKDKRKVTYTSLEKYPLGKEITDKLNYQNFADDNGSLLFSSIHSAAWGKTINITDNFSLTKINTDFVTCDIKGNFNLIYFDAFGPDKQPEMWDETLFRKIASVTRSGGQFVTFSAKGKVKRALRACGFNVSVLPGPPGKREIIRGVKIS